MNRPSNSNREAPTLSTNKAASLFHLWILLKNEKTSTLIKLSNFSFLEKQMDVRSESGEGSLQCRPQWPTVPQPSFSPNKVPQLEHRKREKKNAMTVVTQFSISSSILIAKFHYVHPTDSICITLSCINFLDSYASFSIHMYKPSSNVETEYTASLYPTRRINLDV